MLIGWAGLAAILVFAAHAQTTGGYTIKTVAGTAGSTTGSYAGDGGAATAANLYLPFSMAVDSSGNLYIADTVNDVVRKVSGGTINTYAGDNTAGYAGDSGLAIDAELDQPTGIAFDSTGNVYIVDFKNSVIRQVTSNGDIGTVAGHNSAGAGYSGDNGAAITAQLDEPISIVFDASNNMYIADSSNNRIRKITSIAGVIPTPSTCKVVNNTPTGCPDITTIAGGSEAGYQGDGGPAIDALLDTPVGVAVDSAGNVYFSDSSNHVIRKIATNGIISTVVGTGNPGFSGDGGPAAQAQLWYPKGICMDPQGNLYIADYTNQVIRKVGTNGIIETIAGTPGRSGFYGDGGPATQALLNFPTSVTVDKSGNLYIADSDNFVIREMTPVLPSITTNGVVSASAFGEFGAAAPGSWIEIYGSALAIDSRSWTSNDFNGVNAPVSLDGTSVTIGGQQAVVDYISPGQVNAQVPLGVSAGAQPLVVTTPSGSTANYSVTVNATEPGLFAPSNFLIGGKQYVAATFTDGKTFVAPPNSIPGVTSRLANPGDTIILYGVGFGAVTPSVPAAQIVQTSNTLTAPVTFSFGSTAAAPPAYQGLAPGSVGLYQFNVVVPTVPANSLTPLSFTQAGSSGTQTLYTAIGSATSN